MVMSATSDFFFPIKLALKYEMDLAFLLWIWPPKVVILSALQLLKQLRQHKKLPDLKPLMDY